MEEITYPYEVYVYLKEKINDRHMYYAWFDTEENMIKAFETKFMIAWDAEDDMHLIPTNIIDFCEVEK